jgi:NAD(P)H-dependent FMN reductase
MIWADCPISIQISKSGLPRSFKNALDWLVASLTFPDKPVALINTSPRASAAQTALRLVLTTIAPALAQSLQAFCAGIRS